MAKEWIGQRFGKLVVVGRVEPGAGRTHRAWRDKWSCMCDCGRTCAVDGGNLRRGQTQSCGCLRVVQRTHGKSATPTYTSWKSMRARCHNPSSVSFPYYGGRGIVVCDRWNASFEAFLADMGERPSLAHSLDRIDPAGPYSPENCRWATGRVQANNKTTSRCLTYQGRTQTLAQWGRERGIPAGTISSRLDRGWVVEDAIATSIPDGQPAWSRGFSESEAYEYFRRREAFEYAEVLATLCAFEPEADAPGTNLRD